MKDLFYEVTLMCLIVVFIIASYDYIVKLIDSYNTLNCTSKYCYVER